MKLGQIDGDFHFLQNDPKVTAKRRKIVSVIRVINFFLITGYGPDQDPN